MKSTFSLTRFPMKQAWNVPAPPSSVNPPVFASGEPPPPTLPPDPPDPVSPLSPGSRKMSQYKLVTASSTDQRTAETTSSGTISMEIEQENQTLSKTPTAQESRSDIATVQSAISESNPTQNFTILPPKNSTPIQTNKASSQNIPPLLLTPEPVNLNPVASNSHQADQPAHKQTLVKRLRASEDKILRRLAPVTIASTGRPRVVIPDSVFKKGDSMLHTAQWNSDHSMATPPLKAIKIWAHIIGVPLDLRYDEGLSLVAGMVGEPKETDDFTKNMVSLTVSHVKVEMDLTKPLPPIVEFERESGEVVEVLVHYPWVPPTCSHCHELGHIVRNCLSYTPPPAPETETGKTQTTIQKELTKFHKKYQPLSVTPVVDPPSAPASLDPPTSPLPITTVSLPLLPVSQASQSPLSLGLCPLSPHLITYLDPP
ncbi:hypothetical protein Bca4012_063354 [Brassica carinata]